jgi:hypothetical protein
MLDRIEYYTWVNDQNLFEFYKLELGGITMTSEPDAGMKASFYLLMAYAALIGALSSLITAGISRSTTTASSSSSR